MRSSRSAKRRLTLTLFVVVSTGIGATLAKNTPRRPRRTYGRLSITVNFSPEAFLAPGPRKVSNYLPVRLSGLHPGALVAMAWA